MKCASESWTEIHLSLEKFIKWIEYVPKFPSYTNAWIAFLEEYNVSNIETEKYILTDRYQWTTDMVWDIWWKKWVLDWKTFWITKSILWIVSSWKYRKPYDKLKKASLQLSLYAYALWISHIWVIELMDWEYRFHKLKRIKDWELDKILDNYYNNDTKR